MNTAFKSLVVALACVVVAVLSPAAFANYRAVTPAAYAQDDTVRQNRHAAILEQVAAGGAKLVFVGDQCMQNWATTGADLVAQYYSAGDANVLNLGVTGDRTEHVLWRLKTGGELDGYDAKCVVLMLGGNNTADWTWAQEPPSETISGVRLVLSEIRTRQPDAKVVLLPILPRGQYSNDVLRVRNRIVNGEIRKYADGENVFWCDFSDELISADGELSSEYFSDYVTPTAALYAKWREAMQPYIDYALEGSGTAPTNRLSTFAEAQLAGDLSLPRPARPVSRIGEQDNDWWWSRLNNRRIKVYLRNVNADGAFDVVFLGDSITHNMETTAWQFMDSFGGSYSYLNLGYIGDCTQNLLWRLQNGELDGYTAKCFTLWIGTNNSSDDEPAEVAVGIRKILDVIAEKQPAATTLLLAIPPRGASATDELRVKNDAVNEIVKTYADGDKVRWVDFGDRYLDANGDTQWVMSDRLHPSAESYETIWFDELEPYFTNIVYGAELVLDSDEGDSDEDDPEEEDTGDDPVVDDPDAGDPGSGDSPTADTPSAASIGAHSYVQSGLVAIWDGESNRGYYGIHGGDVGLWTDLVGKRAFTLQNTVWGANYLDFSQPESYWTGSFSNLACGWLSDEDTAAVFTAGDKTLEVVTPGAKTFLKDNSAIVLKCPFSCGIGFGFTSSKIVTVSASSNQTSWRYSSSAMSETSNVTYSVFYSGTTATNVRTDNAATSSSGSEYWGGDTTFASLGTRGEGVGSSGLSGQYPFVGRVTCIRVYNRELSDDERSWNYAIDRVRFHGEDPSAFPILSRAEPFGPLDDDAAPEISCAGVQSSRCKLKATVRVDSIGEGASFLDVVLALKSGSASTNVVSRIVNPGTYVVCMDDLLQYAGGYCDYEIIATNSLCYGATVASGEIFVKGATIVIDSNSYIRNGLLANWDGIDNSGYGQPHATTLAEWTDLVNGRAMALTGVEVRSDSVYFTGATASPYSYGLISADDTAAVFEATTEKTLQLRSRNDSKNAGIWVKSTLASGIAYGYENMYIIATSAEAASDANLLFGRISEADMTTTNTWSVCYSDSLPASAYQNCTALDVIAKQTDYFGQAVEGTSIGRRLLGSAYPTAGSLFALRLYGRQLTADELAWNEAVDRVRFEGANPVDEPIFRLNLVPIRVLDPVRGCVIMYR